MFFLFFRYIWGALIALGMILFWLLSSLSVVIFGALSHLLIAKTLRQKALGYVGYFALWWAQSCRWLLLLGNRSKWHIQSDCTLSKKEWYLLISNHQSWCDILMLNVAFGHRIPTFKYFLKKQLLWQLPVGGLACWMLDYPFVSRYSKTQIRKNPELLKKSEKSLSSACGKLALHPTTIIIFPEGTRFTEGKHKKQRSPYTHLLKPKSQGMAMVINALPKQLNNLLNVTISHRPRQIGLWALIAGFYDSITINLEKHPIGQEQQGNFYDDRVYRKQLQEWLNRFWEHKDRDLSEG